MTSSEPIASEYAAATERSALFDVSQRGKIELTGKDAVAFLHNLCTADIKSLKPGDGCEAFLATAKAKAVAYVNVFRSQQENPATLWLDVDAGRGPAVFQHLDHFLISEQVELSDRTNDFGQLHLHGPEAARILMKVLTAESVPSSLRDTASFQWQGGAVEVRRLGTMAFDLLAAPPLVAQLEKTLLQEGATSAGATTLEMLRVEAGVPAWGAELDENRSVFEVGLNQRAICYTKGCYLGQEPIVMARDRGHINRTLLGLKVAGEDLALQGAKVWHSGQEVGQITSSARSPRWGVIALVYLKRGSQEPGLAVEVETGQAQRATASVTLLPFSALQE